MTETVLTNTVASNIPTTNDISTQQLAVNTKDAKAYVNDGSGNVRAIGEEIGRAIIQTGGGTLTAGNRENHIRDSSTYILPLADSVEAGTMCVFSLSKKYSEQTPTVQRSGSNLIENADGTHIDINFIGSARVIATSDGSNRWEV
tara:strand:+ start:1093 stop:1527 length:435 start_codon:yes stop_codon:yes gene_type:complete